MEPPASATPPHPGGESSLATIVFTDVKGYTTRMAADQNGTLALVHRDLQMMRQLCHSLQGRVVEDTGDGLFMYFASAVNAVACAQEIQQALFQAAAELPPNDVLKHRIGIHLGDVAHLDGGKVKGHAVNMAARLQTIAQPGGICISQTVYDVVKNRLPLPGIYRQVRTIKSIDEPVTVYQIPPFNTQGQTCKRVFISYRSHNPDLGLAEQFYEALKSAGHEAFLAGQSIRLGEGWPQRIETELQQCDYLLLLLSRKSVSSEMVIEEVRRAKELRDLRSDRKPVILPIRVNFPMSSPLNYDLRSYLSQIQQREWNSPTDTPIIVQEILSLLSTGEDEAPLPATAEITTAPVVESPDLPPLPTAEPEFYREPGGSVSLKSGLYIERPPIESDCYAEILQPGALIRIKAPRQMGKTSLMARMLSYAQEQGYEAIPLSLQRADSALLGNLDQFLRWFCEQVGRKLKQLHQLENYWSGYGSKDKCAAYFEECLLEEIDTPIVLGLDEVDRLFPHRQVADDFFALLRSWYESARYGDFSSELWEKLRLVVVHSTEVYIPLDINQSPFNVGKNLELPEFKPDQVQDLAQRYGINLTPNQVEELMTLVGGHPYLVQKAFYHIRRQDVVLEELSKTACTETGIYSDHLRRHLWNLRQYSELGAAFREVVINKEPVELYSEIAFKLDSMGLVKLQGNQALPRYDLYRYYFCDRLGNLR